MTISAVINTKNSGNDIGRCLQSLAWVDEIVVVDNVSNDNTVEIAKRFTDKIFIYQDQPGYVEPIRNFAIEKATCDWVLIVDSDEVVPESLANHLRQLVQSESLINFYEVPRRNIIFNRWIEHTGWWPDYNIRFFKKGFIHWPDVIHAQPQTQGEGQQLPAEEQFALIHYNYSNLSEYLTRSNRYSSIAAKKLVAQGYQFVWTDLIRKPLSEFLTRFFVWEGYKDGVYGLTLSLLQAVDLLVTYIKVWEEQGYEDQPTDRFIQSVAAEGDAAKKELDFWSNKVQGKKSVKHKIRQVLGKK